MAIVNYSNNKSGIPCYDTSYRMHYEDADFAVDVTYSTLFTRSGKGLFESLFVRFDSDDVDVRVTVDGIVLFVANVKIVKNNIGGNSFPWPFHYTTSNDKGLFIKPENKICYKTSILIEHRSTKNTKKRKGYLLTLTEE